MTDRDRLIELIKQAEKCPPEYDGEERDTSSVFHCEGCQYAETTDCVAERIADYLLANGVIVPPCKGGDMVYRVMADKRIKQPYQYKVIGFWYSADETCNNLHLVRYVNGVFESSMSVPFSEFNRILFLTKEEAEQALEERTGKNE